jgi:hypothetical protein
VASADSHWVEGRWAEGLIGALAATSLLFVSGGWSSDDFVHLARLTEVDSIVEIFRTPDPFGFYRPVAHATLFLQGEVHGYVPAYFRIVNVLLHVAVALAAFRLARRLVGPRAALLAAAAFVLTPKAHTVAVLWTSARPEILMSLFSLIAAICWLRWETGRMRWLAACAAAYLIAALSKETALFLPVVLLVTASPAQRWFTARRAMAAGALLLVAAVPLILRGAAGALMPLSDDRHYAWVMTASRVFRSLEVYVPRALPSPAALFLLVGIPAIALGARFSAIHDGSVAKTGKVLAFAAVWFLVFIAPALPIPARSELYLYLPVFGFSVAAGHVVYRLTGAVVRPARVLIVAFAIYVAGFWGYQIIRNVRAHAVQRFSAALVEAVARDEWLRSYRGAVLVTPGDATVERLLRDGIGGYMALVVRQALQRDSIYVEVAYPDQPIPIADSEKPEKVTCVYTGGRVQLRRQ